MQQMMIYWQSIIPQHVSGVFTPIIRRADCVPLPMVSCPGYACQATSSAQCTHLATHLSGTTTTIASTGNHSSSWSCLYLHTPYYIAICGLSSSTIFFHIISQMAQFKKKVTECKMCVLTFSTISVCNISRFKKNLPRYYHKCR